MKNQKFSDFSKFQPKLFGRRRGAQHWLPPSSAKCPFLRLCDLSGRSMRGAIMVHLPPGLSEEGMKSAIMIGLPPGLSGRKRASLVCPPSWSIGHGEGEGCSYDPSLPFFIAGEERVFPLLPDLLISDWWVGCVCYLTCARSLWFCLLSSLLPLIMTYYLVFIYYLILSLLLTSFISIAEFFNLFSIFLFISAMSYL